MAWSGAVRWKQIVQTRRIPECEVPDASSSEPDCLDAPAILWMSSVGGFTSELMLGQLDRRESRAKNSQPWIVIEAYKAEIFRAPQSHFFDGLQQSDRHQVIRDIDAIRDGVKAEHDQREIRIQCDSRLRRPVPARRARLVPSRASRNPRHRSLALLIFKRTAYQADATAPSSRKMAHGFICTLIVVTDHGVFRQLRIGSHDQDERNVHLFNHLPQ